MQVRATNPHLQFLFSEASQGHHALGVSTHTQRLGFSGPWGKGMDADVPHVSSPLS